MANTSSDDIRGRQFSVLDDGFVRVVDYMGSDSAVVQAARVSYGAGTKRVQDDRGLIRYLMRHQHTTPFEMCEIKLHVRVPMDTWRQWIRHRTANVNEYSTRYSVAIDSAAKTQATEWRSQSALNKQGSDAALPSGLGTRLTSREEQFQSFAREIYKERLDAGVAREQARKDLPLSTYTEAYWKIDLHNLLHFLALRMDSHAQFEIRAYAAVIGNDVVAKWVPFVWEAFTDYVLHSVRLSGREALLFGAYFREDLTTALGLASDWGWLEWDNSTGRFRPNRERDECDEKFFRLTGRTFPWPVRNV